MKILIIGYMHPKFDKRVHRTVKTLSKVHEIIYQYWTNKDEKEYIDGNIKYIPIKDIKGAKGSPLKKLISRGPLDKKICDLVSEENYDILYMHHFLASRPLEPFKIAKKRNKKIIYDIHEYHPENFLADLEGIIGNLKVKTVWRFFKKQLELSDLAIFVSEETRNDAVNKTNIDIEKTYIIPNYANFIIKPDIQKKRKEIVLVGKVTRKIEDEKKILKSLIEKGFKFKVIGMDSKEFIDIAHESTEFLPYDEMMNELAKALFSLISYNTVKNRDYKNDIFALPHKFYDSLAAGTPVIVKSSFVSMAKQVENLGLGVVIDPANLEESVEKITNAYKNYENIIKNVEKHQKEFIWNEEKERKFVDLISHVTK
ncbi:glycosyltransferase [Petrotoga olearia]|uniref:Group 1 glycosyl transferase n=2 Tax=Petrotoga olearia TaxID=156203 RepID=A0A2K1NWU5_9BACT|nr:glycosyltransferase [Petrotoga olearia]PNR95004.1 group 1 glycosyl transferase [Petrotoga olearia DSM 13574]RMA73319.1 glycosyltransferase involved in cell wall biosynthesis [Petrotoga olearia]